MLNSYRTRFNKFSLLCIVLLVSSSLLGQSTSSHFVLRSGETMEGRMLVIGNEMVLLETSSGLKTLNKADIQLVLPVHGHKEIATETKLELKPITKSVSTELDVGLTFVNPFALRTGVTIWRNLGSKWQVGVGSSLQFYRFTMINGNINARRFLGHNRFIRPFWETGFGMSLYEYVSNVNFRSSFGILNRPNFYVSDFSPVKQAQTGLGVMIDTGLGFAFAAKCLYNLTWYELTEHISTNYTLRGDYLISSMTLQASFIF